MAAVSSSHGNGIASSSSARPETPPPPPPKDTVRTPGGGVEAYFASPTSRPGSIYTMGRVSFENQLAALTVLALPDAGVLSETVAAIPTAEAAAKALGNAAVQIRQWIKKAEEVLGGLDGEDDVSWASDPDNGGARGVDRVEAAINKFEILINVYLDSMDDLRKRKDSEEALQGNFSYTLDILDEVIRSWAHVNKLLSGVKRQVKISMEFDKLWNNELGELDTEIRKLELLVFEMEETRHHGYIESNTVDTNVPVDIQELQTIMEETQANDAPKSKSSNRLSLLPGLSATSVSPSRSPGGNSTDRADARLMELFARLQPLRASLDFLPIQLEDYRKRAEDVFPSACNELEDQRDELEVKYAKLQEDADRLRAELQEDNWMAAFRNTDRQARKFFKSVELGIAKLQDALESDSTVTNPIALAKKIGDYEQKKNYYIPNLRKIIEIIDKGAQSRKTVNGEVLKIQNDSKEMWDTLQTHIADVERALEKLRTYRRQQLRDSVSTIVSTDYNESAVETPASSPASSIYLGPTHLETPEARNGSRASSVRSVSGSRASALMGKPRISSSSTGGKRLSSNPLARLTSASPSPNSRPTSSTPTPRRSSGTPVKDNKPRWNASPVVNHKDSGYHKPPSKPKSLASKLSIYSFRGNNGSSSNISNSSPLARSKSPNTPLLARSAPSKRATSSLGMRTPGSSPLVPTTSSAKAPSLASSPEVRPNSRAYKPSAPGTVRIPLISTTGTTRSRISLLPIPSHAGHIGIEDADDVLGDGEKSPTFRASLARRPATSLGTGRLNSSLPVPK